MRNENTSLFPLFVVDWHYCFLIIIKLLFSWLVDFIYLREYSIFFMRVEDVYQRDEVNFQRMESVNLEFKVCGLIKTKQNSHSVNFNIQKPWNSLNQATIRHNLNQSIKNLKQFVRIILFLFIPQKNHMDSRARSSEPKNRSMLSTQNMSCAQSYATNFYQDQKLNRTAVLEYADLPFQKIVPRWNQSAATWRNSSHKYSFSKDSRFKDYKVQYTDIIQPQIPTTRSSKSCTFGKGKKRPISETTLRNAKEKPAPDRYNIQNFDQSPRKPSKGKSFGLSWRSYDKNYIDHRKDVYDAFQNQGNPPAKYDVRQKPGDDKKKFSMYGRLKIYTQRMAESKNWVPGARYLVMDRQLDNEVGLHERNFGFGERLDLSRPANNYPGAKYIIPGFTARFHKIAKKMEKSLVEEIKTQQ